MVTDSRRTASRGRRGASPWASFPTQGSHTRPEWRLDNGILTDASLRTSEPGIFAAGDVANALHPFTGKHYRSEHWSNALNGGKVAAKAMLGQDATLSTIPYFYTDQFDVSMEYSGFPDLAAGTEPVIRGFAGGARSSLPSGSVTPGWWPA